MLERLRTTFGSRTDRLILAAFAVSLVAIIVYRAAISPAGFYDLHVYRAEGLAARHGADLYGPLPGQRSLTTYPVFAALCFVPTTLVPFGLVAFVVAAFNIAIVPWICVTSFRICGLAADRAVVAGAALAAVGFWLEPVYSTYDYGQVNLLLLALVLLDFRPGRRNLGIGLGIACAVKVTPLIFVVYLVFARRWRTAIGAAITFVAAQVLSLAVDASDTWHYWTKYLFDLHRVGRLENAVNQTIRGMGVRIEHTRDTGFEVTAAVAVVAIAGLAIAWLAHRRLSDDRGLIACAVTGLLVSPISWSHHWVWCLPLIAVIWVRMSRRVAVFYAVVFASFVVWYLPHRDMLELHFSDWQVAASGAYVYLGLGYLVMTALDVRRLTRRRRAADAAGDL